MKENIINNGHKSRITIGIIMQVLLLMGGAQAATITVNASGGGDYTMIQDAINASNDSDSIIVAAGNYNENVNVNRSVYLLGEGAGVTEVNASNSSYHVFNISRDGVVLEGFTIKGATGSNKAGIYVYRANNTSVNSNTLISNFNGIILYNSSINNITHNNILSANEGIYLHGSANNSLTGNNVSNSYDGIYLYSSDYNIVTDNIAESNKRFGILLYFSGNNSLRNNSINLNQNQGVQIYGSGYNNLTENTIKSNKNQGIYLFYTGNNSIFNNILNNTINFIIDISGSNVWNMTGIPNTNIIGGPYLGGNFWGNPSGTGFSQTCIDNNIDGFCDSSYSMNSKNADYFPLTVSRGYLNGSVTSNGSAVQGTYIYTTGSNTTSGPDGKYSLILSAGTYNITATRQPAHNDSTAAGIIVNPYNTTTFDIALSQKPTGTISGTVMI
ncbi:MAG TPA: NosD domain-containing protein [Candidatus Limnocylindrales bacterium]|nr:NosD domain-containing protein [Candidatus Limnocylindrales bacterium]